MDRVDIKKFVEGGTAKIDFGITKKVLIKKKNKEFFFKENEKVEMDLHNDMAEVLSTYFFKKIGYDNYVDYKMVRIGQDVQGVISQSYNTKDVVAENKFAEILTLFLYQNKYGNSYYDITKKFTVKQLQKASAGMDILSVGEYYNSIEFINSILISVCFRCGIKLNVDKLEDDLYKNAIIDFFMSDGDRHIYNLVFLFKKDESGSLYCELAPSFDHGCAFGIRTYWLETSKAMIPQPASFYYPAIGISLKSQTFSVGDDNFYSNEIFEGGGLFVYELLKHIKKNPKMKELFDKCREVDMEEVIAEFNKKEPVKIGEQLSEYIVDNFKERLKQVERIEKYMERAEKKKQAAALRRKQKKEDEEKQQQMECDLWKTIYKLEQTFLQVQIKTGTIKRYYNYVRSKS